jgi:adenylate kinase
MAAGDSVGRTVADLMRSGHLVPDETVSRIVTDRIQEPDCAQGFILDGYPRTANQAKALVKLLKARQIQPVVVQMQVDVETVIARLSGRRQCPICGTIYNAGWTAPTVKGTCDYDGAQLIVRDDDREDIVRERLQTYEKQTTPALEFLRSTGYFCKDVRGADGAPQVISRQIEDYVRTQRDGA